MNVLIACEFSGIVRDAFIAKGHNTISCDLLSSESNRGSHLQCNVLDVLNREKWDMMIAFPPCTDLCNSGAKWFAEKRKNGSQQKSIDFFMALINAPIDKIAIENPVGIMSTVYRKPDQKIQPCEFGDPFLKTTCLWLKNLPALRATNVVVPGPRHHLVKANKAGMPKWMQNIPNDSNRWKIRSRTFGGIANAMADQWG